MLRGEATNTNFIIFGVTRQGLKPTRSKQTNHYTTDAVNKIMSITGYADLINNILKKVNIFIVTFFFQGLFYCTWVMTGQMLKITEIWGKNQDNMIMMYDSRYTMMFCIINSMYSFVFNMCLQKLKVIHVMNSLFVIVPVLLLAHLA